VRLRGTPAFGVIGASLVSLSLAAAPLQQSDLTGVGFDRGNPEAPIKVVEFGDFGCPACAEFAHVVLPSLDAEFIQTGRVHWKFVPFVLGAFRNSKAAITLAVCAAGQNAFWDMHDLLYRDQSRWSTARNPQPIFRELALAVGIDSVAFEHCYEDRGAAERIREYNRLAKRFSVNATPTLFVGARRIRGALPLDLFRRVLLEATQP
jgi:protein-disulfide isomerase